MKKLSFLALFILMLVLTGSPATGQQVMNVNSQKMYYAHRLTADSVKTYTISQTDTLPAVAIAGQGVLVAGAAYIVLNETYKDSVNVITNIQYRADANASWSIIKRDTLNQTGGGAVTTSTKREIVLRSTTVDLLPGLSGEVRVIKIFAATVNGYTTATYKSRFDYKP